MSDIVLEIDTQFLNRLREANNALNNMVASTNAVTNAINTMVSSPGVKNLDIFKNLATQFSSIENMKIAPTFDNAKFNALETSISNVVNSFGALSLKGREIFDPQQVLVYSKSFLEASDAVAKVDLEIEKVKKSWTELMASPRKNTKKFAAKKEEIEADMAALIEKKAIAQQDLEFAKMTQAQKATFLKKTVDEMLQHEQKAAQQTQREYSKVISDMTSLAKKHDKAKSIGGGTSAYEARFKDLNDRKMQLEANYQHYLVDISKKTQVQIADLENSRLSQKISSETKANKAIQDQYLSVVKDIKKVEMEALGVKDSGAASTAYFDALMAKWNRLHSRKVNLEREHGKVIEKVNDQALSIVHDNTIANLKGRYDAELAMSRQTTQTIQKEYLDTVKRLSDIDKELNRTKGTGKDSGGYRAKLVEEQTRLYGVLTNLKQNHEKVISSVENDANKIRYNAALEAKKIQFNQEQSIEKSKQAQELAEYKQLAQQKAQLAAKASAINSRKVDGEYLSGADEKRFNEIASQGAKLYNRLAEIRNKYQADTRAIDDKIALDRETREVMSADRIKAQNIAKIQEVYNAEKTELANLQKIKMEVTATAGFTGKNAKYLLAETEKAIAESKAKIERIEQEHGEKLKSISNKTASQRLRERIDSDQKQVKSAEDAARAIEKFMEQGGKKRLNLGNSIGVFSGSDIQGYQRAIDQLTAARDKLERSKFNSNAAYERALVRINREINKQQANVDRLRGSYGRLGDGASKLQSMLAGVFGLTALKRYASQLVKVRGEFEMAQRSLQVLLRNKGEADLLWRKTVELAVKSPYTTQQLITATKQLAAYRIESHKLYSTTKMLTDISAGLGVEVNRLVLAFGQVKAANFLRGTELRQFSEAGVNMLDELAARFSRLEGRAVSVAEVFDRISRRKVTFADVEAVLQELTSEGGMFYKMQEQQSETVRGQLLNLKDSVELMYNEMGQSADGAIRKIIAGLKWMIDHWKILLPIIGSVVSGFLAFKTITGIILGVRSAMRLLNATVAVSPVGGIAAILGVVAGLVAPLLMSIGSVTDELASQYSVLKQNNEEATAAANTVMSLTEKYNSLSKAIDEAKADGRDVKEIEDQLITVTKARSAALGELTAKNKEYAASMREAGDDAEKMRKIIEEQNNIQRAQLAFAANIENVNWEDIDASAANYAKAYGKFVQAVNMANKLSSEDLYGIDAVAAVDALKNSGYDLQKFISLFETNLRNLDRTEEYAKTIVRALVEDADSSFGGLEVGKTLEEAMELFGRSKKSDKVKETLNEVLRNSLPIAMSSQILEGLKAEVGSDEYNKAVEGLKSFYNTFIEAGIDTFGDNGAKAIETELSKIFDVAEGWLDYQPVNPLASWAEAYNKWLKGYTEENIGMYNLMAASEQDTVSKKISAIKEEIKAREAHINTLIIEQSLVKNNAARIAEIAAEIDAKKNEISMFNEALKVLGGTNSGGGGSRGEDKWVKSIKTIKEVYEAYDKLSDKFDKTTATTKLWEKYRDVVNESLKSIGLNADKVIEKFGDLTTKDSYTKALQYIAEHGSAKGKKEALSLLAEIQLEFEIKERDESQEKLKREVENLFSGYELSIELDELNIPSDFAQKFFDIDAISIEDLRKKLFEKRGEFIGEEGAKQYQEFLDKLDEMEYKSQSDRLKKYLSFTSKAIGERGKILIDEYTQLTEVEDAFKITNTMALNEGVISEEMFNRIREAGKSISELSEVELKDTFGLSDEQLDKWRELTELMEYQRKMAEDKIREEANKKLSEMDWATFKESEVFAQALNDVESASDSLITVTLDKLKQFKDAWAGLDLKEYSEVLKLIDKLETELSRSNAREMYRTSRKNLSDAIRGEGDYAINFKSQAAIDKYAEINKRGQLTLGDYDKYREALGAELAYRQDILDASKKELALQEVNYDNVMKNVEASDKEKNQARAKLEAAKMYVLLSQSEFDIISKTVTLDESMTKSASARNEKMGQSLEMANELYNAFRDLAAIFFEEDSIGMVFADMGMQMANTVINALMLQLQLQACAAAASSFGAAMNTAMGIIGWIVMGVQLLTTALTAVFQANDKVIQNQIDAQTRRVEGLKRAYDKLSESMDKAYRVSEMEKLASEFRKNIEMQIEATRAMIELEKDRKKPDKDRIRDWEYEIEDLDKQLSESLENIFSKSTDGILDDVLSATRGFVDAWYDAYKEAGNGMKGLEETFHDMLLSMLKQQASMQLISPFIKEYKRWLQEYVNDEDTVLTTQEAAAWAEKVRSTFPEVNELLKGFFEGAEGILATGGELSDLEKGIQGMTEDQAEVLASYWNSCRFTLSNIDNTLTRLANATLGAAGSENPILSELQAQSAMIRSINNMLSSVIGNGGSMHSGAYLKVFMP